MTLTSAELLGLIERDPARPGSKGLLAARGLKLDGDTGPLATVQMRLLRELASIPTRRTVSPARSPLDRPVPVRAHKPFSASDLAWIARLPSDPQQLTEGEVADLRRLEAQAAPRSDDARLISAIVAPVYSAFAAAKTAAAVAELTAQAPGAVPASFQAALAATLRAEQPSLSEAEAGRLAADQLSATITAAASAFADRVAQAGADT